MSVVYWGAGRDSRYSGASRGIGALGLLGCRGAVLGASGGEGVSRVYWGAGRDSRYSGASRGMGASGALGTPRGVGPFWGVGVYWGWQVDWEPNHIGPQSRVPALPLVPLGE